MNRNGQHRRRFLKTTGLALGGILAGGHERLDASQDAKPNIIFIMADDLGWGDVGFQGQEKVATPCLDKMAAEGIRFSDAYAGSTVCAPSRFTLMTGKHIGRSNTIGQGQVLPKETATVARVLKAQGYRTALIGKWGLGIENTTGAPWLQGFDDFYGYIHQTHAHNYYPTYLWRNNVKEKLPNEEVPSKRGPSGVATKREAYSHDLLMKESMKFIEKNRKGPFFLYLPLTIPHANNQATGTDPGMGVVPKNLKGHAERVGMEVPDAGAYGDKPWPGPEKGFAAMVSRMDRDVGRLLAQLRELGLERNTVVFFTSDNGPHREGAHSPEFFKSSGPLRGMKRTLTEGGIRVPFLAWGGWGSTRIKPGVSNLPTAFWDFLPTAADLAGAQAPKDIDGVSILPTIAGRSKDQKKHDYLYWAHGNLRAVRQGRWKLIWDQKTQKVELYNLRFDIGEARNLAEEYPERVAEMIQVAKKAYTPA